MQRALIWTLLAALCIAGLPLLDGAVAASTRLVVIEAAELRAQPVEGAPTRGRVVKGTSAQRLGRSGGWLRIEVMDGGDNGWLRLWQVREAEDDGDNVLLRGLKRFSRTLAGLFRADGDSGVQQTEVTATIGVRGLDAGEFEQAAPAPAALRGVQALRPARDDAAGFARQAGLERRAIAVLESGQSQDWGEW